MKVLVCGDRHWNYIKVNNLWVSDPENKDRDFQFSRLDKFHSENNITLIIEGEARGADTIAREWAESRNIPVARFPALWDRYGPGAGPIRNQQMLDEGQPDAVIAFHNDLTNSAGTKNMLMRARKAGIKQIVVSGSNRMDNLTEQLGFLLE